MSKLEREMEKLEARKKEIYEQFNDTSLPSEQIEEFSKEIGQIQKDIEAKEMRWMELAEYA
jgi:ATP-binding cassette subfamily F protein uup